MNSEYERLVSMSTTNVKLEGVQIRLNKRQCSMKIRIYSYTFVRCVRNGIEIGYW